MEPATLALTIATIFLTKALEKSGENFSDSLTKIIGEAIAKIRKHSPTTATALETSDPQALNLDADTLAQIPEDPIYAELVNTAEAEANPKFQEKFQAVKAGGTINIIGKQITISQAGSGNTQNNNFSNF
ncbi:MAG TPA: hypothetical protein VK203_12940 [Nostocaceae cyanobacterium]|nr:hypothetical protein [Nostocaceae cyanobacterium]